MKKLIIPDQKFSEIVGKEPFTNTQLIGKVWAYIKKNDLIQD